MIVSSGYCRNDLTEFAGSVHQKVNSDLDTAVSLSWTQGSNVTRFGLSGKYTLDRNASVSAKINNVGQLGLGYSQNLRAGKSTYHSCLASCNN